MFGLFNNMNPETTTLIVVCALFGTAVFLLIMVLVQYLKDRDPIRLRIEALAPRESGGKNASAGREKAKKNFTQFLKKLAPTSNKSDKDDWEKNKLRKDLLAAGFRSNEALSVFIGIKILMALALPVLALTATLSANAKPILTLMATFGGAVIGFIGPSLILEKIGAKRGKKVIRELPSVLDLLVIAVEAGLGLDAAIKRVTAELKNSAPLLCEELTILSMELKLGVPRDQALRNLAKRTAVDEVSSLVTMLIQADKFGVSVARSLRVFSDEMRVKRRQLAEEAAAKIPLKLLFPVLFLIFPAIMAVMAGPAILNIMKTMF